MIEPEPGARAEEGEQEKGGKHWQISDESQSRRRHLCVKTEKQKERTRQIKRERESALGIKTLSPKGFLSTNCC